MNLFSISVILLSFVARFLFAKRIDTFIPQYCKSLKHSYDINKVQLSDSGNASFLVITAYLHQGLELQQDFQCYVIVQAPIDSGIVTTVKKASLHDNDTLSFQSGTNPERIWRHSNEDFGKEIVSVPQEGQQSNIYLRFKPSTIQSEHMAGFEIAFTAFKRKGESCGNDFDCENDRCIWSELQCDGYNNCGNNQDESGCAGVSIWIIILLIAIGIAVVVLAIFVWYRMAQK